MRLTRRGENLVKFLMMLGVAAVGVAVVGMYTATLALAAIL